jgi:hypothetical protein
MLFLNNWRVSSHIERYDTSPPAIQKQQCHSREAQIELPLIECELLEYGRSCGALFCSHVFEANYVGFFCII